LHAALVAPVRAFRWAYLPLLMIYFAYGALGITAIADSFWVKNGLTLSAAQLAQIGVWLTLPWTIKMVFGELVDAVPIFGSQRRVYVFIGAGLIATGLLMMASAAARPMPATEIETCLQASLSRLEQCGLRLEVSRERVLATQPADWERLYPATGGALYGRATHGAMASFRRPGARARLPGLYLTGGSVHPGPGVPMAALSGMIAAQAAMADLSSTSR